MNTRHLTFAAIIISSLLVRIIKINQPLLEFFPQRQTQTAEITRNIFVNGWADFWTPKVRYFTDSPIPYVLEFPIYNGLVSLLYHTFSPAVIWGRITSLIFFILSSIIFYKLVQSTINNPPSQKPRRTSQQLTILALIFFTFSPLHILVSRSFQPEEVALFLLLLAVYKKSWAIFSLAVLTKLPIALFAPVMLHRSLLSPTNLVKLSLSLLPSFAWYYRASKLTIHPAIARNFDLSNWFQPQLWFNPRWYFSIFQIEHIWVLTTLGLLFFWLGIWFAVTKKSHRLWLIWLASGLGYLATFNYHAMTHEYYHLLILPALSVFVGIGVHEIHKLMARQLGRWQMIAVAGFLILFITGLIQPALRKIMSAPSSLSLSEEITEARYRLIEDF